jgi:hypothetical protein
MRNKRASLSMEELRSHAKIIHEGSFDATDLTGGEVGEDNDDEAVDPDMNTLLSGDTASNLKGTRSSHNNYDMLITSYSVLATESADLPERSTTSKLTNNQEKNSTSTFRPASMKHMERQASALIRPHREFVRTNSERDTTKISRVERSWLVIAESNRIEEVGEKIFFRYVRDNPSFQRYVE